MVELSAVPATDDHNVYLGVAPYNFHLHLARKLRNSPCCPSEVVKLVSAVAAPIVYPSRAITSAKLCSEKN
jgi:hypothetical protein